MRPLSRVSTLGGFLPMATFSMNEWNSHLAYVSFDRSFLPAEKKEKGSNVPVLKRLRRSNSLSSIFDGLLNAKLGGDTRNSRIDINFSEDSEQFDKIPLMPML
ncbi:hypothetical protein D9757_004461 [Collybiopsis confluens]|uniref:Uncharacterized protein n=1 Tax=Collybiopsis confluens TaxID=2823264 RepID=A0A8H5HWJ9_9AGAR|nr:hypothetical protein D9757_004461 [Collybiopsis confluens]